MVRTDGIPEPFESFADDQLKATERPKLPTFRSLYKQLAPESVDRKENVLLVGNSGTGNTHRATALEVAACRKGYRVRFRRVAELGEAQK